MAKKRRPSDIQAALPATEATLLWLDEAHAFGSLAEYVTWLLEQAAGAAPLERRAGQAAKDARRRHRETPFRSTVTAERTAVRDAHFLVHLAFIHDGIGSERLELFAARWSGLYWQRRALTAGDHAGSDEPVAAQWMAWEADVDRLSTDLRSALTARGSLEGRFYRGHHLLYPDELVRWAAIVQAIDRLVDKLLWRRVDEAADETGAQALFEARDRELEKMADAVEANARIIEARMVDEARWEAFASMGEDDAADVVWTRIGRNATGASAEPTPDSPIA